MSHPALQAIRDLIQEDIGNRGLRTVPDANLVTAFPDDFEAACRSIAECPQAAVAVITGFYIPHAQPPCAETDGPLGAVFLARALVPLGLRVILATDAFCRPALEAGLAFSGLRKVVPIVTLPSAAESSTSDVDYWQRFAERSGLLTHLIALERVGPSHNEDSIKAQTRSNPAAVAAFLAEVPREHWNRLHTMKGRDITENMSPAHLLFEIAPEQSPPVKCIGIGDGGNEIGMGKIPWEIIRSNIPGGGMVACRTSVDHLIVCGISNWGAYGLAAGIRVLRGIRENQDLFDAAREQELLQVMVHRGPLVDGVTGLPTITVDGLPFEKYIEPMRRLAGLAVPSQ